MNTSESFVFERRLEVARQIYESVTRPVMHPYEGGRLPEVMDLLKTVRMDVHKHSRRVERLEIVETGRRRRWSKDEMLRIVVESFQAPRQVAATARRHGISRWQLHEWRRAFRAAQNEAAKPSAGFVPATIMAEPQPPAPELAAPPDPGTIEIDFANGARMRVTGAIDGATLAAALRALSDGRRSR